MGKDREGTFHPGKGKPSGANKEEGTGLRKTFEPDALEQDQRITERYTIGEDQISRDVYVRHPNRNTSKGEVSKTEDPQNKSRNDAFNEEFSRTEPEELLGVLTKDVFKQLAGFQSQPCISIFLPTHKAGMAINEQVDLTAFKNALQKVEKILLERNTEQTLIKKILEPAYNLLREDKFWRELQQGLAVFMANGYFTFLRLASAVSEQVRVNSSFYLGPLVPFMVKKEYFYLLDIAKKFPRFYRADALGIEELQIEEMPSGVDDVVHFEEKKGDKLFRTGGRGGTGGANFHGIGGGKPDEKENIAIYLEEVDDTIWKSHLNRENVPLLLAGQDFLIPIYRSVSDYSHIWPEALTGNHHQQSAEEIYQEALQLMQPYFNKELSRAREEFGNKSATELTSTNAADIISGAYYGRISFLFVKMNSSLFGSFDEDANKLTIADSDEGNNEDLIDKAVIKTIQFGGEVYILNETDMPNGSNIAAVFRY